MELLSKFHSFVKFKTDRRYSFLERTVEFFASAPVHRPIHSPKPFCILLTVILALGKLTSRFSKAAPIRK